jgi:hypothetical protein
VGLRENIAKSIASVVIIAIIVKVGGVVSVRKR